MKEYMARGKDGYDMLEQCEVIVSVVNCDFVFWYAS